MTVVNLNVILDSFYALLVSELGGNINDSYDYRTIPDKVNRSLTIMYMGGKPIGKVTGGGFNYLNVAIILGAQHDKSETSLRSAYRDLNDMETTLLNFFDGHTSVYWHKIQVPYESARPRAFVEIPETQFAEIPVRLLLR